MQTLEEVIRMPRIAPQSDATHFALICGIGDEAPELTVRHCFARYRGEPDRYRNRDPCNGRLGCAPCRHGERQRQHHRNDRLKLDNPEHLSSRSRAPWLAE